MRTKYMLVEREGYRPTAVDKEALDCIVSNPDIHGAVVSTRPVTLKEIKQDKILILEADFLQNQVDKIRFHKKWHGKVVTAKVAWFDKGRGLGMLEVPGEFSIEIYACNIEGKKTWYPETACVYYEKGQEVSVKLDFPAFSRRFAIGLTPGYLDEEGWNRIKDQDLAFRCNEKGEAITGLFSNKGAAS